MKIKNKTQQYRRDFDANLVCEHCGHEQKLLGAYDDAYFHNNVIPNIKCENCGQKAPEDYTPMETVYPEGFQV
jgi:transcription elongation factor Elf1